MSELPAIGAACAIRMAGADVRRFAQAQFAGDVDVLAPGHWQWNAWLTPTGRVRALLWLIDTGDGNLLALLRGGDADATLADLRRYVLRAQVSLETVRFAAHAGGPQSSGTVAADAAGITLGCGARSLRLDPDAGESIDAPARDIWMLADIREGWPTLPPDEPEFLPPALGLERLGAIAFDKGCYPGQEIAARLHFRGGHKQQLCHLQGPGALPIGPHYDADGTPVWILASVAGPTASDALAVIKHADSNEINVMDAIYRVISRFAT